jgi:uracil phosphoribosyltransferase
VPAEAVAERVVIELDHPIVRDKLAALRDRTADVPTFRRLANELALLVAYEATRTLETEPVEIETPLERMQAQKVRADRLVLVPVLRAGLGMLDGALQLLPHAPVGFIGVYREEEALRPVPYFLKLPAGVEERDVLLLDPMIATGGSAAYAVRMCKQAGARRVSLAALIAAPEGIARVHEDYPEVPIYTAAIDRELNENGFILPGLGDAGDRLLGTQ